jgi:hypothetical protein
VRLVESMSPEQQRELDELAAADQAAVNDVDAQSLGSAVGADVQALVARMIVEHNVEGLERMRERLNVASLDDAIPHARKRDDPDGR